MKILYKFTMNYSGTKCCENNVKTAGKRLGTTAFENHPERESARRHVLTVKLSAIKYSLTTATCSIDVPYFRAAKFMI